MNPLDYLHVGVAPEAESEERTLALARAGFRMERIEGRTFVALGGWRPRDGATAVRIITSTGAALALDAPDRRFRRVSLAPLRGSYDLDGDGLEEVPVWFERGDQRCLSLVRVTEGGFAQEVSLPLDTLPGAACVVALEDVSGDARPELLITVRYDALELPTPPELTVALRGEGGTWALLPSALATRYLDPQGEARRARLGSADPVDRLRIAVELAALARFGGADAEAQLGAFDEAVEGASIEPSLVGRARAFVENGFLLAVSPD